MSATERRRFAQSLAATLYRENRTQLHFAELYEVARRFAGYGDATRLDYFDTDARTCTFITKDSDGNYGFRHRSFMEYFCAAAIVEELRQAAEPTLLAARPITKEVLEFIGGLGIDSTSIAVLQEASRKTKSEVLSQNAVKVLMRTESAVPQDVARHYQLSVDASAGLKQFANLADDERMNEFVTAHYRELREIVRTQAERKLDREDLLRRIEDFLKSDAVSPRDAQCFRMLIFDGLSAADVAKKTGVKEPVLRLLVYRIRRRLVDQLGPQGSGKKRKAKPSS